AVTAAHPTGWTAPRLLAMQISMHCYWVGGGLVGIAIAWSIPGTIAGLDFALLALFITLTLDAVRTREQLPSLLIATVAFFAALLITPEQIIFAGMIIFMALLAIRYFTAKRKGGLYDAAGNSCCNDSGDLVHHRRLGHHVHDHLHAARSALCHSVQTAGLKIRQHHGPVDAGGYSWPAGDRAVLLDGFGRRNSAVEVAGSGRDHDRLALSLGTSHPHLDRVGHTDLRD